MGLLQVIRKVHRLLFVGPPSAPGGPTPAVTPAARGSQRPSSAPSRNPVRISDQGSVRQEKQGLTWIGPKETIKLHRLGIVLDNPLAYFWTESSGYNPEPAAIDLRLAVAGQASIPANPELGYWCRYDQLTSQQRKIYLDWLASSRRQVPFELGYAFLFIYGLERRALVEHADVLAIFQEVLRLRGLYAQAGSPINRSFDLYTSSFLSFLMLRDPALFNELHFTAMAKSIRAWNEESIASAASWLAATNRPLPDWFAFALAEQMPKSQRSVVVRRVGEQMRLLFAKRFNQEFPNGFTLKVSKRDRRFNYRPANAALLPMEVSAPNPLGINSQFNVLSEIWNECIADLKRLSSVVGDDKESRPSIETWKAMPSELRSQVDHPLVQSFSEFLAERASEGAFTVVRAREIATLTGADPASKLTAAASRKIAATASDVGYCIEPDANLTGRSYDEDELVAVFLNMSESAPEGHRYTGAATMLRVGMSLVAVDGSAEQDELASLTQQIDSAFELNDHEQRRLDALRAVIRAQPLQLADVTRPLKKLPQAQREQIAKFALAVVAADGVVSKSELKAIQRLYTALAFERDDVNAALRSLAPSTAPNADDPVIVAPATPGRGGEAIPGPPAVAKPAAGGLVLNRAAIAAILRDTHDVAKMLAEAMNVADGQGAGLRVGEPSEPTIASVGAKPQAEEAGSESIVDPSMPARYAAFYQVVVTRPEWTRAALLELAQQHGLMLSGAVEAINDWSTEKHGGPLVYEDDQRFTLETEYLQ